MFIFDRQWDNSFIFSNNVKPVIVNPPARHPLLWYLFFEFGIPPVLKKYNIDLFLSPDGWISLSTKITTISVMHDLNYAYFPEFIKLAPRIYYKLFFKRFAQKASRVVAVSEFTKNDLMQLYKISETKIDVVYNAAGNSFHPISSDDQIKIKTKYTDGNDYFIYIGAIHKRKNLINLFKAFDIFKTKQASKIKLVIVGSKKWWKGEIEDTYNAMKFKDELIFTGRLDSDELNSALASALALTYVSFFEGFGIPIVEAFKAGTPVITSNTTSMPEVAGDCALLVNPNSIDEIVNAMESIASNPTLRKELIKKGLEREKVYNWDKSAEKLWAILESVLLQK